MSFNKSLNNLPKITKRVFIGVVLVGFGTWQLFFLKNALNIDIPMKVSNIFSNSILPDGFCKDCNVILISLDTLRAKSLPCYGYEKNTAPNLCNFAKESFLFTNTYSTASRTLDSHFSIFTSLYPLTHNMNLPFVSILSNEIIMLPQLLKMQGYQTYFVGSESNPHLPLNKGMERGFEKKIDNYDAENWVSIIKENINPKGKKFFAFLHTDEVHEPYMPLKENFKKFYNGTSKTYLTWDELNKRINEKVGKINEEFCKKYTNTQEFGTCYNEEFNKQYQTQMQIYWNTFNGMDIGEKKDYVNSLYDAKIYELDLKLGKLFNYLEESKLIDNTIVIITADHGEEFYEHKGWTHAYTLYNEVIHVPLLIHIPRSSPRAIDKLSSSIDIYPSVLGILGLQPPKYISGINLFSKSEHDFVLAQHVTTNLYTILNRERKLIVDDKEPQQKELYDLRNDYGEQTNLVNKQIDIVSNLEKNLQKIVHDLPKFKKEDNKPFPTWIDEKQRKKLIETGYF